MRRALPVGIAAVLCIVATASAAATATRVRDLPQSYLFTPAGKMTPLRAGAAYRASTFPVPLRLTPPEAGWSGTQWKGGTDYFRGGGPPNFGWIALGRGSVKAPPRGLVTIMTAYARTPSVAATVHVLQTRGHGAAYSAAAPVKVAGFSGLQFDGKLTGARNRDGVGHYFVPWGKPSHTARYYPDEYPVMGDEFRVTVLDVHGKTVIAYVDAGPLGHDEYVALVAKADALLASLRFPSK